MLHVQRASGQRAQPQAHPAQRSCLCTSTYIRIIVFRSRALQQLASNANQPATTSTIPGEPQHTAATRRFPTPTCDAHRNLQPTSTILHYPYLIKPKAQRTGGATRNGATQPTRQRATRPNGAASGEARTGVRTGPRRPRRRAGPRRARAARMPMARARLTRDRPCTDSGDHAPAAPSNAKVAIEISIFRVPAGQGTAPHTHHAAACAWVKWL